MKNIILAIMNIILLSIFNVLFKYVCVQNELNSYNANSSVIGGYITTSNVNVQYLKIFIFSIILTTILFILTIIIIKMNTNNSIYKIISKLNNLILFIFIIISTPLLYLNTIVSFFILIIGFIIYMYSIYKVFEFKKYIFIIFLITILYLLVFYFISF